MIVRSRGDGERVRIPIYIFGVWNKCRSRDTAKSISNTVNKRGPPSRLWNAGGRTDGTIVAKQRGVSAAQVYIYIYIQLREMYCCFVCSCIRRASKVRPETYLFNYRSGGHSGIYVNNELWGFRKFAKTFTTKYNDKPVK